MSYLPCEDEAPEPVGSARLCILFEVEEHRDAGEMDENLKQVRLVIEDGCALEDEKELDRTYQPEHHGEESEPGVASRELVSFSRASAFQVVKDKYIPSLVDDGDQDELEH